MPHSIRLTPEWIQYIINKLTTYHVLKKGNLIILLYDSRYRTVTLSMSELDVFVLGDSRHAILNRVELEQELVGYSVPQC